MIFDILPNSHRYLAMHQGFDAAFAFLRRPDLKTLATDKYPIDGERIYAMVAQDPGRNKDEAQLEVHEKYIDIQMVLAGCDEMGWSPRSLCRQPAIPYNGAEDIGFFADPPAAWLPVTAGMFVVFFPEDAHLPLIGSGLIHKVVVKIATDYR